VEKVMLLEAHGVETAVLEEVYQVRENTIRTWLARGGKHGRKLHDRFFRNLLLDHVQLDELWGHVKRSGAEVWVWTTGAGTIPPLAELVTQVANSLGLGQTCPAPSF